MEPEVIDRKDIVLGSKDDFVDRYFPLAIVTLALGSIALLHFIPKVSICLTLLVIPPAWIAIPIVWLNPGVCIIPTALGIASLITSSVLKNALEASGDEEPIKKSNSFKLSFIKVARKLGFIFGLIVTIGL